MKRTKELDYKLLKAWQTKKISVTQIDVHSLNALQKLGFTVTLVNRDITAVLTPEATQKIFGGK